MSVTKHPSPDTMMRGGCASISFGCAIGCQTCRALFSRRKLDGVLFNIANTPVDDLGSRRSGRRGLAEIEAMQDLGRGRERAAFAVVNDLTSPQDIGPVADRKCERGELLDQKHREPMIGEPAHRAHEPRHHDRREAGRHLVDHERLRIGEERAGDHQHLLDAARRFSSAVRPWNTVRPCSTWAKPLRALSPGRKDWIASPSSSIAPPETGVIPERPSSIVVLPAPFAPSSTLTLPRITRRLAPRTTGSPARLTTRLVTTSALMPPPARRRRGRPS